MSWLEDLSKSLYKEKFKYYDIFFEEKEGKGYVLENVFTKEKYEKRVTKETEQQNITIVSRPDILEELELHLKHPKRVYGTVEKYPNPNEAFKEYQCWLVTEKNNKSSEFFELIEAQKEESINFLQVYILKLIIFVQRKWRKKKKASI